MEHVEGKAACTGSIASMEGMPPPGNLASSRAGETESVLSESAARDSVSRSEASELEQVLTVVLALPHLWIRARASASSSALLSFLATHRKPSSRLRREIQPEGGDASRPRTRCSSFRALTSTTTTTLPSSMVPMDLPQSRDAASVTLARFVITYMPGVSSTGLPQSPRTLHVVRANLKEGGTEELSRLDAQARGVGSSTSKKVFLTQKPL